MRHCISSICVSIMHAAQDKVTRCALFSVPYLDRLCQCGLSVVVWSHIGTLMGLLAAEPRISAGLLFVSLNLCERILVTPYSMVWDWRVSRAGPVLFYWGLTALSLFVSYCFHFLIFHYMGWCCGAGVFGLIGC